MENNNMVSIEVEKSGSPGQKTIKVPHIEFQSEALRQSIRGPLIQGGPS